MKGLKGKLKEKFKLKFLLFIFIIFIIFIFFLKYLDPIRALVDGFIVAYGLVAVFIIAFISDVIMQPIGPDIPLITGILFGLSPFSVLFMVISASSLATLIGYHIGSKFGTKGFLKFYGREKYYKLIKLYQKYNLIVPIAAFTPIPYVPICWISGILRMKKIKFLIYAIISRSLRLALVALFVVSIS